MQRVGRLIIIPAYVLGHLFWRCKDTGKKSMALKFELRSQTIQARAVSNRLIEQAASLPPGAPIVEKCQRAIPPDHLAAYREGRSIRVVHALLVEQFDSSVCRVQDDDWIAK